MKKFLTYSLVLASLTFIINCSDNNPNHDHMGNGNPNHMGNGSMNHMGNGNQNHMGNGAMNGTSMMTDSAATPK